MGAHARTHAHRALLFLNQGFSFWYIKDINHTASQFEIGILAAVRSIVAWHASYSNNVLLARLRNRKDFYKFQTIVKALKNTHAKGAKFVASINHG